MKLFSTILKIHQLVVSQKIHYHFAIMQVHCHFRSIHPKTNIFNFMFQFIQLHKNLQHETSLNHSHSNLQLLKYQEHGETWLCCGDETSYTVEANWLEAKQRQG